MDENENTGCANLALISTAGMVAFIFLIITIIVTTIIIALMAA